MSDLDDLQRKQADLARSAAKMANEKDPDALLKLAESIQERAAGLERMAKNIAAAATPGAGNTGPSTTVVLTRDQRERIAEATGIGLETVTVHDTRELKFSKDMSKIRPGAIEKLATLQAGQMKLEVEVKAAVEKLLKKLRSYERPELQETIDELARDPLSILRKQ
jgi:hypothetical protein